MLHTLASFEFSPTPKILFGVPAQATIINELKQRAISNLLLVHGSLFDPGSPRGSGLIAECKVFHITVHTMLISQEPSPAVIDTGATMCREMKIEAVCSIGGGSVLDAGKAIAAMATQPGSVIHYLDDVGTKMHPGTTLPLIAVPTTAGTGSEATKNAVISTIGEGGFKKSLRHNNFVPAVAIVDPTLAFTCPLDTSLACAMDALTQLIESYVSPRATPLTDALIEHALNDIVLHIQAIASGDEENLPARTKLAYAAMISGITLANAGLGLVHAFGSSLGGLFTIPHGVVCATLLPCITRTIITQAIESNHTATLDRYATIAYLLDPTSDSDNPYACADILDMLIDFCEIPKLSHFGIVFGDIPLIVAATHLKNNPVTLTQDHCTKILYARI